MSQEEYQRLWAARLADLEESGLTQKAWCEQNGIPYSTMKYWMLKSNKVKTQRSRTNEKQWLAIDVGNLPEEAIINTPSSNTVSVNYGGFRVDVGIGTDPGQIFSILRMIKEL